MRKSVNRFSSRRSSTVSCKQVVSGSSLVAQLPGTIPELQAELKAAKARVSLVRKLLRLAQKASMTIGAAQ
jgi:hypothetical protein